MVIVEPTPAPVERTPKTTPMAIPSFPCFHPVELKVKSKNIVEFKKNGKTYSKKEKADLISKDKFVELEDGESTIAFNALENKGQAVQLAAVTLGLSDPRKQIKSIEEVTIEASDKKPGSNGKKKLVKWSPNNAQDPENKFLPKEILLNNLLQLKALSGVITDTISLKLKKKKGSKLAVNLKFKICTHVTSITTLTSKFDAFVNPHYGSCLYL